MNKYTKEILEPIIKDSKSWAEVCRKFNVVPATGLQTHIKSRAKKYNIDFSHFTGQGWNKGGTSVNKKDIDSFLHKDSHINSDYIKKRLIREGIKQYICEDCGLSEWRNNPIPLELHHLDNDHYNNCLENIRILCPNCHSLYNKKLASVVELA